MTEPIPARPRMANLADGHLDDLLASGLSAETIRRAQIHSAPGAVCSDILGYGVGPGMVIPYPSPNGGPPYARVKLNEAGPDGKRYRSPKGRGNHLYIPPTLERMQLADVTLPLYITEGEKKALKAVQEGLCCVALSGVWSFRVRDPRTQQPGPIPDLDALPWAGRTVYIVFDSDLADKPSVQQAEQALAKELAGRGATVEAIRLPDGPDGAKVGLDDFLVANTVEVFCQLDPIPLVAAPPPVRLLGMDAGAFLRQTFPPVESLVDGLLTSDGGGFIGGEEKVGKSYYAIEEAVCLALGLPVCGQFEVATPRKVLFIEEEDSPRRMHARMRALLRGHDLDPDDSAVQDRLGAMLHIEVWEGFSFDKPEMRQRLEATLEAVHPVVVYIDVLRKVTAKKLNESDQASQITDYLDDLRRRFGLVVRLIHHYRKGQGFRTGRGSQEIGGSYVLGAWAEQSLFFEPIGRKQEGVRVDVQSKDAAPVPPFRLGFYSEGPKHAPTLVRLTATLELPDDPGKHDEVVYQAVATLPHEAAVTGKPGISVKAIAAHLKKHAKLVSRTLNRLVIAERIEVSGKAAKGAKLYILTAADNPELAGQRSECPAAPVQQEMLS